MGKFFDINASDILGALVAKEGAEAEVDLLKYQSRILEQKAALDFPEGDNQSDSRSMGNSDAGNGGEKLIDWDRIPKPLLYGSGFLLGLGLLLRVRG